MCLTFDDGYRDNLHYALPILKKYDAPFAIYIPTSFPDRAGELWWLTLEAVIARAQPHRAGDGRRGPPLRLRHRRKRNTSSTSTSTGGCAASTARTSCARAVRDLGARYGVDSAAFCNELCMTWERDRRARRRSARDHRRAHGQSRDAAGRRATRRCAARCSRAPR